MSALDILHSMGNVVGTLPVPASTGAVFGHGTTTTCSAQGFFLQIACAVPVYTACLNTYFMLKIRYNVADSVLHRRYEPWLHAIPIAFALSSATLGVALQIFNPINIPEMGCWIAPYPRGCTITGGCTRGYKIEERLDLYAWLFNYGWLFASFLVVVINSLLIYAAIRSLEGRLLQYVAASGLQQKPFESSSLFPRIITPPSSGLMPLPERAATTDAANADMGADPNAAGETTEEAAASTFAAAIAIADAETVQESTVAATADAAAACSIRRDDSMFPMTATDCAFAPPPTTTTTSEANHSDDSPSPHPHHHRVVVQQRKSRVAAVQSFLYCCATFFTAVWVFMPWAGWKLGAPTRLRVFYAFMCNFFGHALGIFNLYIFVRLQYNKLRETEPSWSRWRCIKFCLTSPASNK